MRCLLCLRALGALVRSVTRLLSCSVSLSARTYMVECVVATMALGILWSGLPLLPLSSTLRPLVMLWLLVAVLCSTSQAFISWTAAFSLVVPVSLSMVPLLSIMPPRGVSSTCTIVFSSASCMDAIAWAMPGVIRLLSRTSTSHHSHLALMGMSILRACTWASCMGSWSIWVFQSWCRLHFVASLMS